MSIFTMFNGKVVLTQNIKMHNNGINDEKNNHFYNNLILINIINIQYSRQKSNHPTVIL